MKTYPILSIMKTRISIRLYFIFAILCAFASPSSLLATSLSIVGDYTSGITDETFISNSTDTSGGAVSVDGNFSGGVTNSNVLGLK